MYQSYQLLKSHYNKILQCTSTVSCVLFRLHQPSVVFDPPHLSVSSMFAPLVLAAFFSLGDVLLNIFTP